MSKNQPKHGCPELIVSSLKGQPGSEQLLENKKTFLQVWDGFSTSSATQVAERIFERLKGEFKKDPANAKAVWSYVLDQWGSCRFPQKMEVAQKTILEALDNAGRLKQWGYLEMVLDELKESRLEIPSFSEYTRSIDGGNKKEVAVDMDGLGHMEFYVDNPENPGWQKILSVCSLRNAPESTLVKWFEAREACESPSVLKNKQYVWESDWCVLINTPPLGFKNACSAANVFYGTSSWLWDASQFVLEDNMQGISAFDNGIKYPWLKAWKSILSKENYQWPWACEKKYQLELFQASLLGLYRHKPDKGMGLEEVLGVYLKTMALDKTNSSSAYLWGPATQDKALSLATLLKAYTPGEVHELWDEKKNQYAELFKQAIENQSELGWKTEELFFNKLRLGFILTNVLQAFPADKDLFFSPKDIEMYKEKAVFYYPGAFELLNALLQAEVALPPNVYDVQDKWLRILNVDKEMESKLQNNLLNHTLQKSIKKIEQPGLISKGNVFRF